MSRISDALQRAGADVPVAAQSVETFVSETEPSTASSDRGPRPPANIPTTDPAPRSGGAFTQEAYGDPAERTQRPLENQRRAPATFNGYNKTILEKLVVGDKAPPEMTEEFRKLAALLHHAQLAHGTKVLMVTSAAAGEGKTLTAANLALTLSQSYMRRVLLIDCDLRKPSVHTVFDVENAAGLLDALREAKAGNRDRRVPVVAVSSRLTLLLSGGVVTDPAALLTSDTLQTLLTDASDVFDWIIMDTPPAAFLPDCSLISRIVDSALLVIRACATPHPLVKRAVEAIGHEKFLGVVMNRIENSAAGGEAYTYYGYGYGYGYGYSDVVGGPSANSDRQ